MLLLRETRHVMDGEELAFVEMKDQVHESFLEFTFHIFSSLGKIEDLDVTVDRSERETK